MDLNKPNYEEMRKTLFPHLDIVEDFTKGPHAEISLDEREEMSQKDLERIISEEDAYFSSSRRKDCFGGSDIATIFGKGFQPPSALARQKQSKFSPKIPKEFSDTGHRAETPIRQAFERVSGIRAIKWPFTMVNPKWPHFRMNIDGLVFENDVPGIYEGKWTKSESGTRVDHYGKMRKYNLNKKLPPIELCPEKYLFQVWGYEAGMELDYGYLCGGWGYSDEEIGFVKIPRLPKSDEEYMLQTCEEFMEIVNNGGIPSDEDYENKCSLLEVYKEMSMEIPHTKNRKELDPSDISHVKKLLSLEEEIKNLNDSLTKEVNRFRELWIKEHGLNKMEKERDTIKAHFQEELMEKSEAILKDGNKAYKITYNEEDGKRGFKKDLCEEKYPDIFTEVYGPSKSRVLRVKELPKGRLVKR